jgi:hypothetical protein
MVDPRADDCTVADSEPDGCTVTGPEADPGAVPVAGRRTVIGWLKRWLVE